MPFAQHHCCQRFSEQQRAGKPTALRIIRMVVNCPARPAGVDDPYESVGVVGANRSRPPSASSGVPSAIAKDGDKNLV